MRRFVSSELGSLDNFGFEEVSPPIPGHGEVRIKVQAVALGFVDALIAEGQYQIKPMLPFVPGGEIGGVVDLVGSGVSDIQKGDRVVTWQLGGGLAEYVVVPGSDLDVIPDGLDIATAATMLVDYQTARYALHERGHLQPEETVLITGATGGVGSAALQIARMSGAHVIAAVSGPAKEARAVQLGAHATISLTATDIRQQVRDISPNGIDVVFDPVGGSNSEILFRALAKEGRYLVIGFAGGSIPAIRTNLALLKSASIVGVDLRHFQAAKADEARRARAELFQDVMYGRIAPPVKIAFAFDQAAEAMKEIRERGRIGKPLVLIERQSVDARQPGGI